MNQVSVQVFEKDKPVALIFVRFTNRLYSSRLEFRQCRTETVHRNSDVPKAGGFRLCGSCFPLGGNDFHKCAVWCPDEIIPLILIAMLKIESSDIPVRQLLRVW